jgi:putative membrane protein
MKLFTDADRARIAEAVQAAEARTSGEIVPVIVQRSSSYGIVAYRLAISGAVFGALLHELVKIGYDGWGLPLLLSDTALFFWMLLFGLLSAWLGPRLPAVLRLFAGSALLDERVHMRAQMAFLSEQVFATRDRTGILLLVSLDEHRVEVLGDSGINERVEASDWADVVEDVVKGITSGRAVDGLTAAIERCGRLLEEKGVAPRRDDTDELSNAPRIQ